jgi:hypothetical protein
VKWFERMKLKYIGTNIEEEQHRTFRVLAAQLGLSASALLKQMVGEFVAKSQKKGGAK